MNRRSTDSESTCGLNFAPRSKARTFSVAKCHDQYSCYFPTNSPDHKTVWDQQHKHWDKSKLSNSNTQTLPAIRIENNHKPCRNLLIIPSGTTSSSAMTKRMSTPTSTESLGFAWSIDQEWKERNTKRRTRSASIVRYVNDVVFNSVTIDKLGEIFEVFANAVCV